MSLSEHSSKTINRRRATIVVLPFLVLGLGNVVTILFWGIDPLWGFMILPPILFFVVLGWLRFKTEVTQERAG